MCSGRVTRRALLAGAILPLARGRAAAAIPRGIVVMAKRIDDIVSLDPAEAYEFSDTEAIANLYDRLLEDDPAHPEWPRGALAASWGVATDGLRYHFTLRPEARFATGRPVTAGDAAFSLQRVIALDLTPAFILGQFGLAKDNVAERVYAADPRTLVIDAAVKLAPSLLYFCLTASVASIVDKVEVLRHQQGGDIGHRWLSFHSAGSGPYRLRIWRPGERYVLDAVPDAWRGAARNREVIVLNVPEPAAQRLLLVNGDADYARDLDKDQLAALMRNPDIAFDRAEQSLLTYLGLNQRNPYLRRPPVVAAIKHLVDYHGIAEGLLAGTRKVHQSFLPDGILGASDDLPFDFDPTRAKALLAAAGLGDGFPVTMDVIGGSPWIDIAQALQAGFARAGIRLELLPGDDKETLTKYRARRHDIYLGNWGSDYPDPQSNAQAFCVNDDMSDSATLKTLAWRNSWQDPDLARRVEAAAQEADVARRAALYRGIERDHQRAAPFVIMFQQVAVAAHRRNASGFVLGSGADRTRYAGIVKR